MKTIKIGDVFKIDTSKGMALLHYIYDDKKICQLIRVLPGLYTELPEDFNFILEKKERYMVFFPVLEALKKNIISKLGNYPIENFKKPMFMKSEHTVRGTFLGWHIINTETWQREFVEKLTVEQKKLSPWGVWNDTYLKQRLITNWSLED